MTIRSTTVCALALFLFASAAAAQIRIDQQRPAPRNGSVCVSSQFGSIEIVGSDGDMVVVQGTLTAGAEDFSVTRTSSPRASSMTAPKMMFASACAASWTRRAASLISNRPRSEPPWIESSTPCAPSMLASSSGEEIAISAAWTARSSPRA